MPEKPTTIGCWLRWKIGGDTGGSNACTYCGPGLGVVPEQENEDHILNPNKENLSPGCEWITLSQIEDRRTRVRQGLEIKPGGDKSERRAIGDNIHDLGCFEQHRRHQNAKPKGFGYQELPAVEVAHVLIKDNRVEALLWNNTKI